MSRSRQLLKTEHWPPHTFSVATNYMPSALLHIAHSTPYRNRVQRFRLQLFPGLFQVIFHMEIFRCWRSSAMTCIKFYLGFNVYDFSAWNSPYYTRNNEQAYSLWRGQNPKIIPSCTVQCAYFPLTFDSWRIPPAFSTSTVATVLFFFNIFVFVLLFTSWNIRAEVFD